MQCLGIMIGAVEVVYFIKIYGGSWFSVLVNEVQKIKAENGKYITISGLDDFY